MKVIAELAESRLAKDYKLVVKVLAELEESRLFKGCSTTTVVARRVWTSTVVSVA